MPLKKDCSRDALQQKRRHELWRNSFLFTRPPISPSLMTPETSACCSASLPASPAKRLAPSVADTSGALSLYAARGKAPHGS